MNPPGIPTHRLMQGSSARVLLHHFCFSISGMDFDGFECLATFRLFISFSLARTLVSSGRSPSVVTGPSRLQMCFHFLYILFVD